MDGNLGKKAMLLSTILLYCLIGIEIVIMISPFALYFYSVYGPVLKFLSSNPYLSWTGEFFLPHMVFLDDPLILGVSYLQIFFIIGLILFFVAAVPLYYGRFTGKGVVSGGLYAKIRHPQYLFLAISGFGLLLYWPRFIILVFYITMLFVYYILARNEEWRMKRQERGLYEYYMVDTGMFLPGGPGGKIYGFIFGWIPQKWIGILLLYLLTMGLALGLALGLRTYCVNSLPIIKRDGLTMLPVFPVPEEQIIEIYQTLEKSPQVGQLIKQLQPELAYIFPGDYFLTALVTDEDRRFSDHILERFPEVLEWHQNKFRGGLGKFFKIFYNYFRTMGTVETDYDVERIVFVEVGGPAGGLEPGQGLFDLGVMRRPIFLVDMDADTHELLSIKVASGEHKWGSMAMPTF